LGRCYPFAALGRMAAIARTKRPASPRRCCSDRNSDGCIAPNDRGILAREDLRETSRGWQLSPWSGHKGYTPPLTMRLRLEEKVRNAFVAASTARDSGTDRRRGRRASANWAPRLIALRLNQVAVAVAHKTGERIGLDTSTRMAMNAVFAPDREYPGDRTPQPFSRADGLKGALALRPFRLQFISLAPDRGPSIVTELEIQASDGSGAIVAAAEIAMPPRTIGLSIFDSEGRAVFSRRRGDRSRKRK
jgi:hypothetical protein